MQLFIEAESMERQENKLKRQTYYSRDNYYQK